MYILYTCDWWLIELPFQFNVGFFAKNFGKFTLHEMQKINVRKARFNPRKVRLNIEKLRKRILKFYEFFEVFQCSIQCEVKKIILVKFQPTGSEI